MIPFVDLRAQYHSIKSEIDAAVMATLESTQFVLGKEVTAFEEEFAEYIGARYAIGVNSGTSALHLALLAAGVGPGDEVVTVSCTFFSTIAAIEYTGARPVLVDVDRDTLTMTPGEVEAAITERTKAILPVHFHGHPADMDSLISLARRHEIKLIEDAAHGHGAGYKGRRVGALGDLGCFSFYPGKNLGAYGEGGLVATNDEGYAHTICMLRDCGQEKKYHHVLRGYNYRMDGIQGAILRVKLRHLEDWTEARRAHAAHYNELLAGADVTTPVERPQCRHVYHVYAVRTPKRDALQQALQSADIQTNIHYPTPVHLQAVYEDSAIGRYSLPHTETAARELLSLPMYPELSASAREKVSAVVARVVSGD